METLEEPGSFFFLDSLKQNVQFCMLLQIESPNTQKADVEPMLVHCHSNVHVQQRAGWVT